MRTALVVLGGLALAAGAAAGGYFVLKFGSEAEVARLVDEAIAPSCGRYDAVSVEPLSGQARIEGLVLECFGDPETTFTAQAVTVGGADAGAIETIFDVGTAPADPVYAFLPVIDRILLRDAEIASPTGRAEIARLELAGLEMRRLPRPPVMSNGEEPYTRDDLFSLLAYHTRFAHLEADGLQSETTLSGETAGAESLTLERFEAGAIDVIELVGVFATIANRDLSAAHAELLLISEFDAGGFVQAKVFEAQAGDAPYIAPQEPPSPTIGNTLIEGIELELADTVALVDQLKLSDLEYVGSFAVGGRVEMQGFEVELSEERAEYLRKLGYRRFVMNLKYLTDYDDEAKTWVLEDFRATAVNMGWLELEAKFVGIHLAPTQERVELGAGLSGQWMTPVVDRTALESARIAFTDEGFLRKFIEVGAAEAEVTPQEFIAGMVKDLQALAANLDVPTEALGFLFADLQRFLENPGTMELTVKPKDPVNLVAISKQIFFAPEAALEEMGIELVLTEG